MGKFPDFERVKEIAVPIDGLHPGLTVLDSFPHYATPLLYKDVQIVRESNLIVYINDAKSGYYIGYIKDLNHQDFKGDKNFNLVVRRVIPDDHGKFRGRVYLEERLERGDEFLFYARDLSRDGSKLYGRFLSYDVFCFSDLRRKKIEPGTYLRVMARLVREDHSRAKVEPLEIVSQNDFEREINRIFRARS